MRYIYADLSMSFPYAWGAGGGYMNGRLCLSLYITCALPLKSRGVGLRICPSIFPVFCSSAVAIKLHNVSFSHYLVQ